jgi:hypothetical protein
VSKTLALVCQFNGGHVAKTKLILSFLVLLSSGAALAGGSSDGAGGGGIVHTDGRVELKDLSENSSFLKIAALPQRVREAIEQLSSAAQRSPKNVILAKVASELPSLEKREIYLSNVPLVAPVRFDQWGRQIRRRPILMLREGEIWLDKEAVETATIDQIAADILFVLLWEPK